MLSRRKALLLTGMATAALPFATAHAAKLPPQDLALLDALEGQGANPLDHARLSLTRPRSLAADATAPAAEPRLPPQAQQQVNVLAVSRKSMFELATDFDEWTYRRRNHRPDRARAEAQKTFQDSMTDISARPRRRRSCAHSMHSTSCERMTWFWFNHFQRVHRY